MSWKIARKQKIKKTVVFSLIVTTLISSHASLGQMITLGTVDYIDDWYTDPGVAGLVFSLGPDPIGGSNFISWGPITTTDVGRTFFASAATDPHFSTLADLLTNGQNDLICRGCKTVPGGAKCSKCSWESDCINNLISTGVDFQGYMIETIGLTVNTCTITPETYLSYDLTYSINGIPEPTTLLLLGLGSLALLRRQTKFNRRVR